MMGRSHAVSGAAVWLGTCAASTAVGYRPGGVPLLAGAVVCAGFALLPDLDHPPSLIARTFGPVTQAVAAGVSRLAVAVHARTATAQDRPSRGGHRQLTHTAVFAVAVGLLVAAVAGLGGRWAVAGVVFTAVGLALRGLLTARERRRNGPLTLAAVSALAAVGCAWLPGTSWAWLGLPAGLGCLAHTLGDALTRLGVPLLWPVPVAGQRWYRVGIPRVLRITTDGWVESRLLLPVLVVGGGAAGVWTLGMFG